MMVLMNGIVFRNTPAIAPGWAVNAFEISGSVRVAKGGLKLLVGLVKCEP